MSPEDSIARSFKSVVFILPKIVKHFHATCSSVEPLPLATGCVSWCRARRPSPEMATHSLMACFIIIPHFFVELLPTYCGNPVEYRLKTTTLNHCGSPVQEDLFGVCEAQQCFTNRQKISMVLGRKRLWRDPPMYTYMGCLWSLSISIINQLYFLFWTAVAPWKVRGECEWRCFSKSWYPNQILTVQMLCFGAF